ncbi:hypothetical protein AYO44_16340 [Planctomycetaceae bacterium SCGC AG-212-F19]|nr:hypothetical protein AYO44_16340 [Planctomycetaceae bacterium SCGC AG-212-F19]
MLQFLHGKVGDRKLRLFALSCVRRIMPGIFYEDHREAVDVMQRFLDGQATAKEYEDQKAMFRQAVSGGTSLRPSLPFERACPDLFNDDAWVAANSLIGTVASDALVEFHAQHKNDPGYDFVRDGDNHRNAVLEMQASALRDIVGNPIHSPTLPDAWRTSIVTSLAHAIYTDRAFDRMPILGDALEDAGCTNADILAHCRQPGPHVRGCWVVDLVMGKD